MNPVSSSLLTFLIIQLLAVVCFGETSPHFESDVHNYEKPVFDQKGFLSGGLEGLPQPVDAVAPDDGQSRRFRLQSLSRGLLKIVRGH